ncbi:MAG: hypothetical protein DRJ15_13370 [Bacteroidetes bacterium]|nr:MAG: hypothetical protein DRJ15_13370 [Bacteroidota bacterium]
MARLKKPENETSRETEVRRILEHLANVANRSEKTSWNRKMDNLVKLMVMLEPIEQNILDIIEKEKMPMMDQISELRATMVKECIHPFEYLIMGETDDVITCKFCNKKINPTEWLITK